MGNCCSGGSIRPPPDKSTRPFSGAEDGSERPDTPTVDHVQGQLPFDGKDFQNKYQLGDVIGEGAFSKVKLATFKIDGPFRDMKVAVKCVERHNLPREDEENLLEEARILRKLRHPNVIKIYQFFKDDPDNYYEIIEFMEGGELFDRIVKKAYYNEKEARDLCRILLDAVKYIHDLGIVHRDLKPENLLLTSKHDDANIKLADFGFARSVRNGYVSTQCGTPDYVAPEVLHRKAHGTSVDMWSIGVIIYILLGGYSPFQGQNDRQLFCKIKAGNFKFHDQYWRPISSDAKDLIKKLLTVNPKKRITAAQAVSHPWLIRDEGNLVSHDLSNSLEQLKLFNARRKLRAAIKSVVAAQRLAGKVGIETWNS